MPDHWREELCHAISRLAKETEYEEVCRVLGPYFDDIPSNFSEECGIISPLMIACDRGNMACLEYLGEKNSSNDAFARLIGRPLDKSKDDENTPMHFAASTGNPKILDILARFGEASVDLGSPLNKHGDTPMMMAALHGNVEFVKRWIKIAEDADVPLERIRKILGVENHSGDTCISLACCHGHPDLLEVLIILGVEVNHKQVEKCKNSLKRMEHVLSQNPSLFDHRKKQVENVRASVVKLELELSRRAEEAACQLLSSTEIIQDAKKQSRKKKKPRRKVHSSPINIDLKNESSSAAPHVDPNVQDNLKLTQLANGTVAVSVSGTFDSQACTRPVLGRPNTSSHSAEELFRQRFEGQSPDLEAVMDSLCLDVSMLLYTPHGMALNLSPSQLDAVHQILEKQLAAVQQARDIQRRLHEPPCGRPGSGDKNTFS